MQPLVNGIANVVIFKEGGESIVYPFVCSWKDGGYSSSLPSEATYRVNKENKTIVVTDELGVLELKVLESGSNSMLVEHLSYGLQFKYYKVKDVEPLCDLR